MINGVYFVVAPVLLLFFWGSSCLLKVELPLTNLKKKTGVASHGYILLSYHTLLVLLGFGDVDLNWIFPIL